MIRKTAAVILASFAFAAAAGAQQTYFLPRTSVSMDVETVVETFHAGPYAEYAKKYLGIEVRSEDSVTSRIASISMTPQVEADMAARYPVPAKASNLLSLSSQGLVSLAEGQSFSGAQWRFPATEDADFAHRGVSSNFSSETKSLFMSAEDGSTTVVTQNIMVEKSLDKRAAEAADMVVMLRKTRIQIITGDTDMTYSGEAMGAAVAEMTRLEQEYLSLFTGYTECRTQTARFEVIPETGKSMQKYVAFRLSDSEGAVAPDDLSGSPVVIEFVPEEIAEPIVEEPAKPARDKKSAKPAEGIHFRIPAVCAVRVYDGASLLVSTRMPVYQLGVEEMAYSRKR